MSVETANGQQAAAAEETAGKAKACGFNSPLFVRRIHMYLALFLVPWMLTYGISVIYMNHMPFFERLLGQTWGKVVPERELIYDKPLPADPEAAANQILADLHLSGWHWTDARRDGSRITINRNALIYPRRITFTPADHKLVIQREPFDVLQFLRRIHKRRGYEIPYVADYVWAASVDLVVVSLLVWSITGLWTWSRMKKTLRWGMVCAAAGCVLFVVFLVTI